ncbi:hypothetical protein ABT369_04810 [Dactylosporangium sp. NPDC000244]|uniref:hypothetical protein n=1 Tax=Dactylosporangium sp. NPDC000244 TaxID=3154365 RepID=UPI003318BBD4
MTITPQPGVPGQQRADLAGLGRVVEHDQQPAVGGDAAVQTDQLFIVGRQLGRGHAQRAEEPGQYHRRCEGRGDGVPLQVCVELPVGVVAAHPMGDVQRERGLADPGRTDQQHRGGREAPPHVGVLRLEPQRPSKSWPALSSAIGATISRPENGWLPTCDGQAEWAHINRMGRRLPAGLQSAPRGGSAVSERLLISAFE